MPRRRLEQLLSELHAELNDTKNVDEDARALLRELMKDIRVALAEDSVANSGDVPLDKRLHESLDHFESEHPTLALNIRRVLDALGRIS